MAAFERDAGSFRDRSGEIYFSQGRIFRTVNSTAAVEYEALRGRCFYEQAAAAGFLVGAKEIDVSLFGSISISPLVMFSFLSPAARKKRMR